MIAIEEHPGFAGTVAKLEPLLECIPDPAFGVAFDTKNTMREGEDPLVLLSRPAVLDRVLYTHVDNFRQTPSGWDRSLPAFAGDVDVERLLLGLRSHGYDGWLSVEYGGKEIGHVFQSVEWLRRLWAR